MSTSRVSSLAAGYRLPSNLTLAARRPTGMASLRLPPLAPVDPVPPPETPPPFETWELAVGGGAALVLIYAVMSSQWYQSLGNGGDGYKPNGRRRSRRRHRRH